jgi:hypothetical protein
MQRRALMLEHAAGACSGLQQRASSTSARRCMPLAQIVPSASTALLRCVLSWTQLRSAAAHQHQPNTMLGKQQLSSPPTSVPTTPLQCH